MKVYVLGAGASAHAGYPLASPLGTSLAGWIETLQQDHQYRSRLTQIIGAYGSLANFEAVLADLMTSSPGSPAAGLPAAVRPYLLSDLQEAIREYFDTIRKGPTPLYDQLANSMRPDDLVITFNYDLGIEHALAAAGLWDITTGYGFSIGDPQLPSPINVLKLHGSTNWRALLFGGHTGFSVGRSALGARPVLFFRPDQEYIGFRDFVDPLCAHLDSAASLPAMIMPALPKQFYFTTSSGPEWKPFWDDLWRRAQDAIEKAEELFILGYSMPVVDGRARDLLFGATNKAVPLTICCSSRTMSLEQEFRDHGFTAIRHFSDPSFAGFLKHQPLEASAR
jgi:hypothetical protein